MPKANVASERKDKIVKATVECIIRHGYHNFSMQDVARTAGVSKGIIHYYFLNKDDLMMSVLDKVAGDIEDVLVKDIESIKDPIKKIEVFVDISFGIVKSTKEYYQVNMDFWTQINQKEEVKKVIAKHYDKFRETAAMVIASGMKSGVFRDVNPRHYASLIISVIDGLSLQWLFDESVFEYDEITKVAKQNIIDGLLKK